jgi:predicted HTH transcriptional regulator
MTDDAVVDRLDLLIATFKLAFASEITVAQERIRGDAASAGILDATVETAVKAGDLKKNVADSASTSEKTVERRIRELVTLGALRQIGSGSNVAYQSTGLV